MRREVSIVSVGSVGSVSVKPEQQPVVPGRQRQAVTNQRTDNKDGQDVFVRNGRSQPQVADSRLTKPGEKPKPQGISRQHALRAAGAIAGGLAAGGAALACLSLGPQNILKLATAAAPVIAEAGLVYGIMALGVYLLQGAAAAIGGTDFY